MNKFVRRWRKFEFKRSYIFKDMDSLSFWIFLDFSRIYFDLILFKKMQKGVLYLHKTRGADVARGTRADATWHARPRGSATRTHALRWHGRVAGPHKSMRTPGWCHVVV